MAITKSAKKAQRASEKKAVFNARRKKTMKDSIKEIGKLIAGKKGAEAEKMMPTVQAAIDKAIKRNLITKNTGARMKSRLVKRVRVVS